jgi:hypothetical protein
MPKDTKFQKGQSGNPKGRPKGSLNSATLAAQALLDGEAEALTRKAIEKAKEGDMAALRLCLERLCPSRRERLVAFETPVPTKAKDGPGAMGAVIKAVIGGEITPGEGQAVTAMLEAQRRAIETEDLARRVAALEQSMTTK